MKYFALSFLVAAFVGITAVNAGDDGLLGPITGCDNILHQLTQVVFKALKKLSDAQIKVLSSLLCKNTCLVSGHIVGTEAVTKVLRDTFCNGDKTYKGSPICEIINGSGADALKNIGELATKICKNIGKTVVGGHDQAED